MEDKNINTEENFQSTDSEVKENTASAKKHSKKDVKALVAEIEELKAQIKEKDDRFLRMAAEYDNFRRRSREEKEATYDISMAETVAEILPIIDNLERAEQFDDAEKVKEGLVMIMKSAHAALAKLGIEEVGKVGEKFDPKLHNAVLHVEDENLGENEIVEVFQKGYKKGAKIIRFAMVKTTN